MTDSSLTSVACSLASRFSRDVEETTPLRPLITATVTSDGGVLLLMELQGGSATGVLLDGYLLRRLPEDSVVRIADELSEEVSEILSEMDTQLALVWPKCPLHDHSMDPALIAGLACWTCRDGSGPNIRIGDLSSGRT
jgi:hypothetical protein